MDQRYVSFADLPHHVRQQVLRVGESHPESWVLTSIPALGGRSIVETMNEPDGDARVHDFLAQTIGKFS